MNRASVQRELRALLLTALASLRVVGLAYAGLGGIIAVGLVISVAFLPVAPAVQQATQPAQQLMTGTADAVVNLIGGPALMRATVSPIAASSGPAGAVGITAEAAAGDVPAIPLSVGSPDEQPPATPEPRLVSAAAPVAVSRARPVAAPVLDEPTPPSPDEGDVVLAADPSPAVIDPAPVEQTVVLPTERAVLQVANDAPAKPLPPLPPPADTAAQVKARVDAQNQAAIDAAKAARARSRAQANDANQAAIDAAKGIKPAATPVPVPPTPVPAPTQQPVPTAQPTEPPAPPPTPVTEMHLRVTTDDAAPPAEADSEAESDAP